MRCKTVLVVEDDVEIRETLKQWLEFEGYPVTVAENGKAALDLLKNLEPPCLILLDLMMPVMNGWEFLEAKRKSDILAIVPVVVVSAAGDAAKAAKEQGADFVKKPIDLDSMIHFVKQYCG